MDSHINADDRLLDTLQRLLAIPAPDLRTALGQACTLVAEALSADKVDVFLYEAASETLVAAGTRSAWIACRSPVAARRSACP